eukprot:9155366-Alexandrium_andersonii.AAC.1
MSASLVGSEMCIRDSPSDHWLKGQTQLSPARSLRPRLSFRCRAVRSVRPELPRKSSSPPAPK